MPSAIPASRTNSRAAAWVVAMAALLGACQTRPKADSTAGAGEASAGAAASAGTEAPSRSAAAPGQPPAANAGLPPAQPARPMGAVIPAPWLAGAERVAALAHDGAPHVIAAGTGWLRVFRLRGQNLGQLVASEVATAPAAGAAHVLEVLALASGPVIAVGRGLGREAQGAPPSVMLYRFDGSALSAPESVPLPPTTRAQVIGIAAYPGRPDWLWIGMFESKYTGVFLGAERQATGTWTTTELGRARVPLALAAGDVDGDGTAELLVARPYGEDIEAAGDVFLLRPGPAGSDRSGRTLLPSTRGARAIVVHGREVVYADGWHRDYGREANALISRARWSEGGWHRDILAHVAGRYGYDRLRVGDIDGDGAADVIAAGNGPAVWVPLMAEDARAAGQERGRAVVHALGTADAVDAAVVDIDDDGKDEVAVIGSAPGIWQFRRQD